MSTETTMEKRAENGDGAERTRTGRFYRPNVDILENADELLVHADMPGVAPNDIEFRRFTCAQPKDSARLSGEWRRNALGGLVRASRYGDYCSIEAIDQIYSAEWVTDVMVEYRVRGARVAFGIDNVTNTLPDVNLVAVSNRGGRTFPRNAPFGFNGRYVYGKIGYTF